MDTLAGRGGHERRSRFFYELSEDLCTAVRQTVAGGDPDIEEDCSHLWEWFWDISRGRQVGMNGWLALPAVEIRAWQDMTGNIIRAEELQVLRDMDQAFLSAMAAKDGKKASGPPSGELSIAAFDAVFG